MRQLVVFRHGKSDWGAGQPDHERPLNQRGEVSASAVGRTLTNLDLVPDHAITSSAVRARTTLELAIAGGDWPTTVDVTDDLYDTTVQATLDVVAQARDTERLMVVGHMPTWASLVRHLTGGHVAMRTATVAVIEFEIASWDDIRGVEGEILTVLQPRHLPRQP